MDPIKDPEEALKIVQHESKNNLTKLGLIHTALIIHMPLPYQEN